MLKTASIVILNNLNSINQENQIKIHGKYNTPVTGIAVIGFIGAAIDAFVPITDVVQLVNIGTLAALIIVSFAVIMLRKTYHTFNALLKCRLYL